MKSIGLNSPRSFMRALAMGRGSHAMPSTALAFAGKD
jgi:hypothetical protein